VSHASTIAEFTQHHNFTVSELFRDDTPAIEWLHDIKRSIDTSTRSHSDRLVAEGDPSWAMILTMLDRVYEHAAASVVSYFTGTWASMEVIFARPSRPLQRFSTSLSLTDTHDSASI
jgi:hypothetical protein